ncbi:MAG: oligosaccharide flippase family protein [Betaproteobacteria bacterium]|nr:oligosaccharide flippase family protein [Betaproteobacteria bacterium]
MLLSMRILIRNVAWNLGAQIIMLSAGMAALPLLLHFLGAARLGVFTLGLGLIGFSGLFDLGLGRALTQTVSSAIAAGRPRERIGALVYRVQALLLALGLVWMSGIWSITPWLVEVGMSLHGHLASETMVGLRALALSLPFALAATAATGALEGLQEFRLLSRWRMALVALQFGLPVVAAAAHPDAGWAVAALAVARVVSCLVWSRCVRGLLPFELGMAPDPSDLRHVWRFGGWLSLSNVIGPLMAYADRFFLATVLPPSVVANYTVPFDAAQRVTSLPLTAMNVLFPALTQSRGQEATAMLRSASKAMIALLWPAMLVVAVFARLLLSWWLSPAFAGASAPVLQWILVGVVINGAAHIPYALLQAHGRSDITAKLHLLELPIFALVLLICVHAFGIVGAALAWTARIALDAALLHAAAWWVHADLRAVLAEAAARLAWAAAGMAVIVFVLPVTLQRMAAVLAALGGTWLVIRVFGRWRTDSLTQTRI